MGCFESSPQTVMVNGRQVQLDHVKKDESFIAHHIAHELKLSPNTSSDYIRRRQILEHAFIEYNNQRYKQAAEGAYDDFLIKGWMQRVFLECIDQAEVEFFNLQLDYDLVRAKIADRYLFEYYQLIQFSNAGLAKILTNAERLEKLTMMVSAFGFLSDGSLFQVLKELKSRFPQVADKSKIEFPAVEEKKQDVNLLQNIPKGLSFSDPQLMNLNTTLFDLKFLFDRALSEFDDFKNDMKVLLGEDVLTDAKVKAQTKGTGVEYAASAVRRVFIKWVETMLQRLPEVKTSREYLEFLKAKTLLMDGFHIKSSGFKSSIQQSVVVVFLYLLQTMKYNMDSGKPVKNPKYGFFIYDLLRCKAVRKTPKEIMEVLAKMNSTTTTASGKKFKVVRVKNRFKTPNRDLMVNFCYGDVIVAEAQLCVDSSDVDKKSKKMNKFNHYLYELQRGILGPTIQLMTQYEDLFVPGLQTKMFYEGMVQKRVKGVPAYCKSANRKCFADHDMIEIKENYFFNIPILTGDQIKNLPFKCDFCFTDHKLSDKYHYCEKCGIFLCLDCNTPQVYQKAKKNWTPMNIFFKVEDHQIKNQQQFYNVAKKKFSSYVLFYNPESSPSIIARDFLAYIEALMKNIGQDQPPILYCDVSNPNLKGLINKYGIKKFPAAVVIDKAANLRKMLIGCSIFSMVTLDDYRTNLENSKGKSGAVAYLCMNPLCEGAHKTQLQYVELPEEYQEKTCFNCLDIDVKDEGFVSSLFKQTNKKAAFACQTCQQVYCLDCCYLAHDQPDVYQDPLGASYLSTRINEFKQTNCPNSHAFKYIHKNVFKQPKYDCSLCHKNFFFSQEDGMGQCQPCSLFCCPECMGVTVSTLESKNHELVNHYAIVPAFECNRCIRCKGDLFRLYKGRVFLRNKVEKHQSLLEQRKIERAAQGNQDADSDIQAIGNFFQDIGDAMDDPDVDMKDPIQRMKALLQNDNWRCITCKKKRDSTIQHFSCFTCNYEICFDCMNKYGLFKKGREQFEEQRLNEDCDTCGQKNAYVVTEKSTKADTRVDCDGCKRQYYPNSIHLSCSTCKSFYCLRCTVKALRSNQGVNTCDLMHPLVSRGKNPIEQGIICKKRPHIIGATANYFSCSKCQDYFVCNNQLECHIPDPDLVAKCDHQHELEQFEDEDTQCQLCGFFTNGSLFGCGQCSWWACQACIVGRMKKA